MSPFGGIILFFLAAAVHEAGHLLTAKLLSVPCRRFGIVGIGALLEFDFSSVSYIREAAVHLGGAFFGIISALTAYFFLGSRAELYLGITAVLSAVNLLPIRGTDGSAALEAFLLSFLLPDTASGIVRIISVCVWVILWCCVMWIELRVQANLSLILFAVGLMMLKS